MNTDEDIYRHHSLDIDLTEPLLDEPEDDDYWQPLLRHDWAEDDIWK
jgi:hypothetical protein